MNPFLFEFIGTLVFMYVILATKGNPYVMGCSIILLVIIGSKISTSGTLLNPAVTVAMMSAGKVGGKDVAPYIGAQILGGIAAVELYKRLKFSA